MMVIEEVFFWQGVLDPPRLGIMLGVVTPRFLACGTQGVAREAVLVGLLRAEGGYQWVLVTRVDLICWFPLTQQWSSCCLGGG